MLSDLILIMTLYCEYCCSHFIDGYSEIYVERTCSGSPNKVMGWDLYTCSTVRVCAASPKVKWTDDVCAGSGGGIQEGEKKHSNECREKTRPSPGQSGTRNTGLRILRIKWKITMIREKVAFE